MSEGKSKSNQVLGNIEGKKWSRFVKMQIEVHRACLVRSSVPEPLPNSFFPNDMWEDAIGRAPLKQRNAMSCDHFPVRAICSQEDSAIRNRIRYRT